MTPDAEIAPKIVVVLALVFGTVTTANDPFLDHAMLRFMLIWSADSSRKTQFFSKVDVSYVPYTHPVKAFLDPSLIIPVYRLKPGFFQRQIAFILHKPMKRHFGYFESLKSLKQFFPSVALGQSMDSRQRILR